MRSPPPLDLAIGKDQLDEPTVRCSSFFAISSLLFSPRRRCIPAGSSHSVELEVNWSGINRKNA